MHVTVRGRLLAATSLTATLVAVGIAGPAVAAKPGDSTALQAAVTAEGIIEHLEALGEIAAENGGNRAAGTPGHEASAAYIEQQLHDAGYTTERQEFSYTKVIVDVAVVSQVAPTPIDYVYLDDFYPMDFTPEGDVTAPISAVDINLVGARASTSGCEPEDFVGFPIGNIALIQRGTCDFSVKATNAAAAGATAVLVFNQGNTPERLGAVAGTLGAIGIPIPVVGTTFAIGESFAGTPGATARVALQTHDQVIETFNVLADTKGANKGTTVVGAHLDSVPEGPGINDNGSGSAAILETAIQMAELDVKVKSRIRFAFWSGEEDGLQGSNYYVSQLNANEIKKTAANLNFDMVGSPNPARFVYDGDGDAFGTAGPVGSEVIEGVFNNFFAAQGLATAPTAFDGRSDYLGFIEAGIPAGGLFSGAEGIKTEEEAVIFGGAAGQPYDPCYHSACDTADNIDPVVLEQMADAIAHSTYTFGTDKRILETLGRG